MAETVSCLKEEIATFEAHKQQLVGTSAGKYALVKGNKIVAVYSLEDDAISAGYDFFADEPFLVRRIEAVEIPLEFVSNNLEI